MKPSSKEVGPDHAPRFARDEWNDGVCTDYWEGGCEGKERFYLAAFHNGCSVSFCEKHAAERRQYIRKHKRRVKKRLAAFRVGQVPERKERHPDWEDDGRWTK